MKFPVPSEKIAKKRRCAQCNKLILFGKNEKIGRQYFCLKCTNSESNSFPECLVLRIPEPEDGSVYKARKYTCALCNLEGTNPYQYERVLTNSYCSSCVAKLLSGFNTVAQNTVSQTSVSCLSQYCYDVSNLESEEKYWEKEVEFANNHRHKKQLEAPANLKVVDIICIRKMQDQRDPDSIDSIELYVYSNEVRSVWCFSIRNNYVSGWDGWPVYMGGFITPLQFLDYMHRIGNRYYDNLIG